MQPALASRFVSRALVAVLATVTFVVSGVLLLVTLNVRDQARQATIEKLDTGQRMLSTLEARRADDLRTRIVALAESPTLKAALDAYHEDRQMGGPSAVRAPLVAAVAAEVDRLASRLDPDVLAARDSEGELLTIAGRRAAQWVAEYHADAADSGRANFVTLPSGLFRWIAVPVMLQDVELGTIQLAKALDDRYASELASLSGARVLIVSDDRLVATTLDPGAVATLTPDVLRTFASVEQISLGHEEYAARAVFREGGSALYILDSVDAAARPLLRSSLRMMAAIAAGAFVLAGLASVWLGRSFSRPIDSLTRSVADMTRARDFGPPLTASGATLEIDQLTATLNTMMSVVKTTEDETLEAYLEGVRSLAVALDQRDPYTTGHSQRVSALAVTIGRKMGLDEATLDVLRLGALLHDVGKIGISEELLSKPGPLTAEEYESVKAHPTVGSQILQKVGFLGPHLPIVELHHERPDGSGYPYGLKGTDIPVLARIVHVADAYDAMTTARPYRPALPPAEAVDELRRCAGTDFDADVVRLLTAALSEEMEFPAERDGADSAPPAPVARQNRRDHGLREVKKDPLDDFGSEQSA
jgi:putative nucleotidyltransferase with HDIG domain